MDSKTRFSDRVDAYVKYRPGYPSEVLDFLYAKAGFRQNGVIADIGSETGIFSRLLLERGSTVYGIEPNEEMRQASIRQLAGSSLEERFIAIDGSAEHTTLADHSIDSAVSAQAFHWFDIEQAKVEFARIIKPGGMAALVWNRRKVDSDPFAAAYDKLLMRYASDYDKVKHTRLGSEQFASFYRNGEYGLELFANKQLFNLEQLEGRTASSSYTPLPGHPDHVFFYEQLKQIFIDHQQGGQVAFHYQTEVYYGFV
ncbi:class I SAM-dependent methyltransferase [Paenibacillus nasutitermitis]|uniref:Methyltransferase n=1 Tax=Paenibacillus nasutitermitis TaxID=1652958 RepID=A0A916YR97_9BACL|nr:class I SAM-dependent methyltransferase [Paenibacillus nasutitermitis]GGD55844.1 methyltransferase [Paenibacillus nasutitermitis]